MANWNEYPYTDFHQLNLDWIISKVKEYITKTDTLEVNVTDLQEYVSSFVEDLDIQDAVNTKLDEMYQNGQLAVIISQFLTTESILAYDNIAGLRNAQNIVDGVPCLTLGRNVYNDGYTLIYKVREMRNTDVIDNYNIVALINFPNLVAEKINSIEPSNDRFLVFGDSWSAASVTDAIWTGRVASNLNMTCDNYSVDGARLATSANVNNVEAQVDAAIAANLDSNRYKFIIIFGGINDYRNSVSVADVISGVNACCNKLRAAFPKSLIYFMTNCQYPYNRAQARYWKQLHDQIALSNTYIDSVNMCGLFGHTLYNTANYFHLTQDGQKYMAQQIIKVLNGGAMTAYDDTIILSEDTDSTIKAYVNAVLEDNMVKYVISTTNAPAGTTALNFSFSQLSFAMPYTDLTYQTYGSLVRGYFPYVIQRSATKITILLKEAPNNTFGVHQIYEENIFQNI